MSSEVFSEKHDMGLDLPPPSFLDATNVIDRDLNTIGIISFIIISFIIISFVLLDAEDLSDYQE